jgi:hypothetical protein
LNLHQSSAKLVEILNIPKRIVNALYRVNRSASSSFQIGVRGRAEWVAVFGADKLFIPLLPKHRVTRLKNYSLRRAVLYLVASRYKILQWTLE